MFHIKRNSITGFYHIFRPFYEIFRTSHMRKACEKRIFTHVPVARKYNITAHYNDVIMGAIPDCVWNHRPPHCLLNRLFRHWWKKTSKLRVTGLCAGNSPVTSEFHAQRASNAENVSISSRHHAIPNQFWRCNILEIFCQYALLLQNHLHVGPKFCYHCCPEIISWISQSIEQLTGYG